MKYHSFDKTIPMWYQKTTLKSVYSYHVIKLSSSIIKSSKGSECLFLFKGGWSLLIKRLSIKVTVTLLLLLASMERLSKPNERLQNK